ncbi:hypothetical protein EG240_09470 [Paenimyroides tangerinum]|uniref:Uncharacterized protein n=1 Tax=Paenimyroides tangerinum TaxID=2488728 RepID=A0A3P3W8K3_9FLAO|nr:hypothetical protein [Paenimyroides tangerinum]RRJ90326.1 hypothetical protein EG240_09470 [Paenimyroides tangerinum]
MLYQPIFNEFYELVKKSITEGKFAKLTLAKTIGDTEIKNVYIKLNILENNTYNFALLTRYKTEEIESFHSIDETFEIISSYIKNPFLTVLLFTIEKDYTFKVNKKNAGSIVEQEPTFKNVSPVMQEMIDKGII